MLLHLDTERGIALSKSEIKEMAKMYESGFYHLYEILEEYGINLYRFRIYMAIANDLGYIENFRNKDKFKMKKRFEYRILED